MNVKAYVERLAHINNEIENTVADYEFWVRISEYTGTDNSSERVQSSGNKQKMEKAVCNFTDIEQGLNDEIHRLAAERQDIIDHLKMLPPQEYNVLHKMYVQGYERWEVSDKLHKSISWVDSVHGRALSHLQKILTGEKCKKM